MIRTKLFLFTVALALTLTSAAVLLVPSARATECCLYELTDASMFLDGCYDPCDCLLRMFPTLAGDFLLVTVYQTEDSALFQVLDVDWSFIRDDETVLVTGSGTYAIEAGQHQMILDLLVGGNPVQQFDSGLVPRDPDFSGIRIAMAMNGFYCYDNVFDITASQAPVAVTQSTWGNLKVLFR